MNILFNSIESEQDETSSQQDDGMNGNTNIQLTDEDKKKGNLKNFNISKKTIKKLKGNRIFYQVDVKFHFFIYFSS